MLDLRGRDVVGHTARVLTAPALNAHNTAEAPSTVAPAQHAGVGAHARGREVDLPAHSYVTVALDLAPGRP